MIKKIKIGFQLLKYQHNFKKNVCLSVILLIMGVFFCLDSIVKNCIIGVVFLECSGMFLFSTVTSIYCTELFKSSPKRKFLETKSYTIENTVGNLIGLTICIGVKISGIIFRNMQSDTLLDTEKRIMMIQNEIFFAGIMTMVMAIYIACAYKYFIGTVIAYCIVVVIIQEMVDKINFAFENNWSISTTVVVAYLAAFLGCVIAYFLTCLFYKKKMSVLGQPADLRKYLK